MSEYKKYFVLRVLYNNSDMMTDYYEPRRTLKEWILWPMPGKIVTENKLRRLLKDLPPWLRALKWEYIKAARGSMCYPVYGSLDSGGLGLTVPTYNYGTSGVWMTLTVTTGRDPELSTDIPANLEAIRKIVDERNRKEREDREYYSSPEYKSIQARREVQSILNSHAVIGAKGLEVLTPGKKIEKLREIDDLRQVLKVDKKDWSKFVFEI